MFWIIVVAAIILMLFGNIEIKIDTIKKNRHFYIVKIYFLGIRVYKAALILRIRGYITPQLIMIKKEGYRVLLDIPESLERRRMIKQGKIMDLSFLLKAVTADNGEIKVNLGTGNAASTALLCEGVRTAADVALKIIGMEKIKVKSMPNFKKEEFYITIACILSTFPAQIIYRYLKQKGGR